MADSPPLPPKKSLARRIAGKARSLLAPGAPGDLRVSREAIVWSYRILLGRDPENNAVVDERLARASTLDQLRREFTSSEEFRASSPAGLCQLSLTGNEPPLSIETTTELGPLFAHIQRSWESFGNSDPYWSVLTSDEYRTGRIEETREQFYDSGRIDLQAFLKTLERNGIDRSGLESCLEYGCGVGRITLWLAQTFPSVTGIDISSAHLNLAQRELGARGAGNVTLRHLARPSDIDDLPPVDVVYSIIVLQHNPPPVIAHIIRRLLAALRPGGIAYFQVPTYRTGYRFSLASYLRENTPRQEIEMHVLPQAEIFRIIHEEGCRVFEVLEDGGAGLHAGNRSNTFLVRKLT